MSRDEKAQPTVEEIVAMLGKTSLPTVLVEGKTDIIFYRSVEESLSDLGIDMLPAGSKGAVLEIHEIIRKKPIQTPITFVVDKDLWVYPEFPITEPREGLLMTAGYSIENDAFEDGEIIKLMHRDERATFNEDLSKFIYWYALAVDRSRRGGTSEFKTHPGKVLDDPHFYDEQTRLVEDEVYPEEFRTRIERSYGTLLRGKSLFWLASRIFSAKNRKIKFAEKQLMEIGACSGGPRIAALTEAIRLEFTG